jgi:hypothetical protein
MNEIPPEHLIAEAATDRLRDPSDALHFVDRRTVTDADSARAAVDALIKQRPYLASTPTPVGDADQGVRGSAVNPHRQLGRNDLARMSAKEIEEARQRGQFDDLLGRH